MSLGENNRWGTFMRHLFQIATFSFLAASCPSFATENEEIDTEMEELTSEKFGEVISKLDSLSKKLEKHVQDVSELNEEEAE